MSTFRTSDAQKVKLYKIATEMKNQGLSDAFVAQAVKLAEYYEGAYDLFELWMSEEDENERDQIVSDLQDEIDENTEAPKQLIRKPYIPFDDLATIAQDVTKYKNELRKRVDMWGGISKLAKATGIPQPSLSRFFSSATMPRRTTLYKIAHALDLSETDIKTNWMV